MAEIFFSFTIGLILLFVVLVNVVYTKKHKDFIKKRKMELLISLWVVDLVFIIAILEYGWYRILSPEGIVVLCILIGIILLPGIKKLTLPGGVGFENFDEADTEVPQKSRRTKLYGSIDPYSEEKINILKKAKRNFDIAKSLIGQNRLLEAEKRLIKSLAIEPNNWFAEMLMGFIYLTKSDSSEFGLSKAEMLDKSINHSRNAVDLDPNHFNQYMNLGIAQGHMEGSNMLGLAISNLKIAADMINNDKEVNTIQSFMLQRGKCITFMGEFAEKKGDYEGALRYRLDGKEVLEQCTDTPESQIWLNNTNDAIKNLKR